MAWEYLGLAGAYPPPSPLFISKHLRWIFRAELQPAWAAQLALSKDEGRCRRLLLESTAASATNAPSVLRQCGTPAVTEEESGGEPGSSAGGGAGARHASSLPDLLETSEVVAAAAWRVTAWNFLVRPYLTEHWQVSQRNNARSPECTLRPQLGQCNEFLGFSHVGVAVRARRSPNPVRAALRT